MIKKIKQWYYKLRPEKEPLPNFKYTREQMEKAYNLGYNDGRRDGIAIARDQATKSLQELLWRQRESQR